LVTWAGKGNWSARCSFDHDDTNVYCNAAESWGEGNGFEAVCDSLTHFIATLALQEAVMSCPHLVSAHTEELPSVIDVSLPPLWLDGHFFYGEPTHNFYYDSDHDLIAMNWGGIWLGSHTPSFRDLVKSDIRLTVIQ
jgi:hypothetical protein